MIDETEVLTPEDVKAIGRDLKKNTRDAFTSDMKRFLLCGYPIMCTTSDLELYLTQSAQGLNGNTLSPDSLARFLSSFRKMYRTDERLKGIPDPSLAASITEIMAGLHVKFSKPPKQAASLSISQLQQLYDHLQDQAENGEADLVKLTAARDMALVAIAFWRGLRADTLGSIRADAVIFEESKLKIYIPKQKQVKEHKGKVVTFEAWPIINPLTAMEAWLKWNPKQLGMLFPAVHYTRGIRYPEKGLNRKQVTKILRDRLEEIGVPDVMRFSAHSFRHSLGRWGGMYLDVRDLMIQGGWASYKSVEHYIQDDRRVYSLSVAVKNEVSLLQQIDKKQDQE